MKRDIINYGEFLAAIDKLFTQTHIHEYEEFRQRTAAAKEQRKETLPNLSEKLNRLKAEIETYKRKIRQAREEDNKKELGIRLNQLMRAKQELVKIYRAEKNTVMFSELLIGTKAYACTRSLVQKYLLPAFVKSSPQSFRINPDDTVSLNVEYFLNSDLYQQISHIRDFVTSYITHHNECVRGERYFVGLYKNVADFDGIVRIADEYFEKINQKNTADNLRQSHEGFEQFAVYPEYGVQAVRLKTKEALDYEGKKMHHCVATYAKRVQEGETEIYSIRDLGNEEKELVPHATIEFKNGKITQIKGPRDSLIDNEYVEAARLLAISLAHCKDLSDFFRAKSVADSEMRNLALYKDEQGIFHDIYNISDAEGGEFLRIRDTIKIKDTRLKALPLHKLKLNKLEISGIITDKTVQYLARAKEIQTLFINEAQTELSVLDLSAMNCSEIELKFKQALHTKKIILPPTADVLIIRGDMPELCRIETSSSLKTLELHGKFDKQQSLPKNMEGTLILDGSFPSFTGFNPEELLLLKKISLKGDVTYLPPKVVLHSLQEFDINEAQVINLEHVDLSQCAGMKCVDFSNSRFYHLKTIKTPKSTDFSGSHCVYDALENLDVRNMPYLNFGTLEKIGESIFFEDTEYKINFPKLGGCLLNFSIAPKLKEIYFPENIKKISFLGCHIEQYDYNSLVKYKALRELYLSWMEWENCLGLDLSQFRNLEVLCMDANLPLLNLPESIKELKVERHKDDKTPQLPDLTGCTGLTKVCCDFIPDMKCLPPVSELLDLNLVGIRNDVVIMDFSAVKNLMIKTSSSTEFPNLQKIVFAENFGDVVFFKTCPLLSEIDLSRTKGTVALKEIDYTDEILPGERNIYVSPEQFVLLEKIKLGAQTELILPKTMASQPVVIELPPQTPQEKLNDLQQKYPCARIIKEQKNKTQPRLTGREDR